MVGSFGGHGKLFARLLENAHVGVATLGDEAFEAHIAALASYQYMIEAATAGPQGFGNRVNTVEKIHKDSLVVARPVAPKLKKQTRGLI
jgi:hypothetical protein